MSRFLLSIIFIYFIGNLHAGNDSVRIVKVDEYMAIVGSYHPVARQASLLPQQARAELRIARGGFDPFLYSDYNSKTYDGTNYYSFFETAVKIPLWYGVEVKAGYDFAYGSYLNPESKLPGDGLGYLGINVPLGSNLVFDKRRAALRQAQVFQQASEQERLSQMNDLFLEALKAYYDWCYTYAEYNVYKQAVVAAEQRFVATLKSVQFGDRPAIDTTEALTQLQSRQLQLVDSRWRYINAALQVNNFMWQENGEPYPFDTLIVPAAPDSLFLTATLNLAAMEDLGARLRTFNPQLALYNLKLKQLDIERRLKIESLKPQFNLQYNLISNRFNFQSDAGLLFTNGYKFGMQFSMPLAFTQARGELRQTNLKIKQVNYEFNLKSQQLGNKLRGSFYELVALQQQATIYLQSVAGFKTLLDGEQRRFQNGESSLFLVNARETRYLDAQVKTAELFIKYYKAEAAYKWVAGFAESQIYR